MNPQRLRLLPQGLLPACLLLLAAPAGGQEMASGPVAVGVVTDRVAGSPVAGATVSLLAEDGRILLAVLADARGRYAARVPKAGSYRLRAQGVGYHPQEGGPFPFSPADTLAVDFQLLPSPIPMDSILVSVRRRTREMRTGEQLVYGRLLDDESGQPIPQGLVRLVRPSGTAATTLTDDEGLFWLVSPMAGTYRLQAERIGYETSTGPELHLMLGDTVGVDFYLSVEAILLNPLVVRASARPWEARHSLLGLEPFLQRMSRFGESGFGTFLTRDGIAAYDGRMTTANLLLSTVMEVRALNDGGGVILREGCTPRYYVDGTEFTLGPPADMPLVNTPFPRSPSQNAGPELLYPPETLEAVEVYVAPTIPAEFSRGFPCGVVALWTRRPRDGEKPVTRWRTLFVLGGFFALGFWYLF